MSATIDEAKAAILDAIRDKVSQTNGAYDAAQLAQAYATLVDAKYREWSYSTARVEPKDAGPLQNALGET